MKQMAFILIVLGLFISCNNIHSNENFSDSLSVRQNPGVSTKASERQLLIKLLKNIQAVFASNDKEKIAQTFNFPLADTTFSFYIDDSTFQTEYKRNDNRTTKAMFIKYFSKISHNIEFDQLNQLFKQVNLDKLTQKDTLEKELRNNKEKCYKFYHVFVDKDLVTLEFGSNTNNNFADNSKKPKDDESFGDECEFSSIWLFHFDGKQLQFIKQMAAG